MDRLGLPGRIPEVFSHRSFRWALHALVLALAPVTPEDPAALAIAGLAPDAAPPSRDEAMPTLQERDLLSAFVQEITRELHRLLGHVEIPADSLREFVCARRAEIIADPGWIEAHFSLDDVSTELRRAALDLDPGHVPWLGVVVKFVYE